MKLLLIIGMLACAVLSGVVHVSFLIGVLFCFWRLWVRILNEADAEAADAENRFKGGPP